MTSLPTAHFVAMRQPFLIGKAQCVQGLFLKPGPFCKLYGDVGSTHMTIMSSSGHFSSSPTLSLSLLHFPFLRSPFYLTLSSTSGRNCHFSHPPFLLGCNRFSVIYFFRVMTRRMRSKTRCTGPVIYCPLYSLFSYLSNQLFSFL